MKNGIGASIAYHLEDNRSIYIFTTVLFLMGIIFGAVVVNSLGLTQKHDLYMYLSQFFGQVSEGQFANSAAMFSQSFAHYAKYVGLMWILGLSIVGLPIILILLFLKGVAMGFTVGFLVNQMGMSGFALSFVSVMPQNFILVPAFIIVGTTAVAFSLKMIRNQFIKKNNEPIFPQFLNYSLVILVIGALLSAASAFEAYVTPGLMRVVLSWVA
ncbi:stage II sporulation protein M [Desertibacillus haloalkaliphilus]|uniref:stage II sporulation protein M n=1 Tax=Desertibacillus haloalkaliphilus TaxID=1328930 RepID=UPI001C259CC5|nr:stage II sporulation protein M [Desertibacillus haloalkaliphilus]MBU8907861.1 stage II sporulation protein M [Desertibacillus haloalkaliphilus]